METVVTIVLVGFVVAVAYNYLMGTYLERPYPFGTFLFRPNDRFGDFVRQAINSINLDPYTSTRHGFASNYPPLTHVFLYMFTKLSLPVAVVAFVSLFLAGHFALGCRFFQADTRVGTFWNAFVLTFLSYPVLIAVDRGNMETYVFLLLAGFVLAYRSGHFRLAAVFVGLAAAMKIFPILLAVMFLADRRYREFLLALLVPAVITVACFALMGQGFEFNLFSFLNNLRSFGSLYGIGIEGWMFGHSLFGLVKVVLAAVAPGALVENTTAAYMPYQVVALVILVATLAHVVFVEPTLWKRLALLVICMCLLPVTSGDYKLIHLYLPLYLFIQDGSRISHDRLLAVLFGLLLIPKAYLPLFPESLEYLVNRAAGDPLFLRWPYEINMSIVLNPLLLIGLWSLLVVPRYMYPRSRPSIGTSTCSSTLTNHDNTCHFGENQSDNISKMKLLPKALQ